MSFFRIDSLASSSATPLIPHFLPTEYRPLRGDIIRGGGVYGCTPHGALFTYCCRSYSMFSGEGASSVGKVYVYETAGQLLS